MFEMENYMKKMLKVILAVIGIVALLFIIDLICIFAINRPLLAIKEDNGDSANLIYRGLVYNTYNCHEYSSPQIKLKGSKFTCAASSNKIIEIIDKTKDIKDFACNETLESFYQDDNYNYYWNCIKNEYMIVKYENGYEETISEALKKGTINIKDLDSYNIECIKEKK